MSESKGLQKIIYNFNHFVRTPLQKSLDDDQENPDHMIPGSVDNIVGEGNVIARIIDFDDPEYNEEISGMEEIDKDPASMESEFVFYNPKTKEFISKLYGFAALIENKLQILPLFWHSENKLTGYLYIHSTIKNQIPTVAEIRKLFDILKLIHVVEDYRINSQIDQLRNQGSLPAGQIIIAEGGNPQNGMVEKIELRKSLEKTVGKQLEDGRIDYKEKDSFHTVEKGEIIAEKIPEIPPTTGVDIFGKEVKGILLGESPYHLGKNLEPEFEGSNIYISKIDGVLELTEDNKLNIEERLVVNGDVNLNTGNIHFPGIVEITGSVLPGFTVEATKDIIIRGNVEDAIINAEGNIYVENGILGKEHCKVTSKGTIKSRFVQNAELIADKNIEIIESSVQANFLAKEYVIIGGKVVGGEILGRYGVKVAIAGSASESKTILIAGKDPDIEKQIDILTVKINEEMDKLKNIMDEITQYFGENVLADIKNVLISLPVHRKKQLHSLLQGIKDTNAEISENKTKRDALKSSLKFPEPVEIKIIEDLFTGVTIHIKGSVKKIEKRQSSKVNFREDPKTKSIYWE